MNTHDRISRMYQHKEADRVPFWDTPWNSTIEQWNKEGLPKGVDYRDFFEIDRIQRYQADNSPSLPEKTLEETAEYRIYTTSWGTTLKQWKHATSTPEFLDFTLTSPDVWKDLKARMTPDVDRIPWDKLKAEYPEWRKNGDWLIVCGWFGFDVTHSWMVGTERVLMALVENPEWCVDMWNHQLDVQIKLYDMMFAKGYTFDSMFWWDDMGFKHNQFFSLNMYRELLKPVHKRAIEWAHSHGMKAHLHSCGDIRPFLPDLVELGLDTLNPLEVKAGMDPIAIKKEFGDKLVLHGGFNAVHWDDADLIISDIRRDLPALKHSGGYFFASDHSIPDSVSLETFRRIVGEIKKAGSY
jgi:uroporphyrinogen decarboxylase